MLYTGFCNNHVLKPMFGVLINTLSIFIILKKWSDLFHDYLSRLMGKPTICIGENKDADQLRGNREADQRLCFHY